jgi:hypothetical protein
MIRDVDLKGNRIVCGINTVIDGQSSETSSLTSTGLGIGVPMISSNSTVLFRQISFKDVDTLFDIDGGGVGVIDWFAFNIENVPNIGTIANYENCIINDSAWINSTGCTFTGNHGTIGFTNSIFTNFTNMTTLIIDSNCVISRRLKIVESAIVTTGTGISIDFSVSASVPAQGYNLNALSFTGGTLTHLAGVNEIGNQSLFFRNVGIKNSKSIGQLFLSVPTATVINLVNTWYKISGTTISGSLISKFTHTNNRLTYTGTIDEVFTCNFTVSLSGGNNNVIEVGISKNGAIPLEESISVITLDNGGATSNLTGLQYIELIENDYIELFVRNLSSTSNITANRLSLSTTDPF